MEPRKRYKCVLISPEVVLMLLFAGGRWRTDDIPLDAKVVDADYDDYRECFVLTLESPSFPLASACEPPILDVVVRKDAPMPAAGENH